MEENMKKTIVLVISIVLLLASIGVFGYLYYKNNEIKKETVKYGENIKKLEKSINDDKEELTEKEDEYEKLKEKVKDSLEELEVWENMEKELNKA